MALLRHTPPGKKGVLIPILHEVAQNSDPSREGWGLFDAALQRIGITTLQFPIKT